MANTRFSDIVLDDANLSLAAKGVFVTVGYLGNGSSLATMLEHCRATREELTHAVQELIDAGYVSLEGDEVHIKAAPFFGVLG